jgi:hypothetical protein
MDYSYLAYSQYFLLHLLTTIIRYTIVALYIVIATISKMSYNITLVILVTIVSPCALSQN